MKPTRAYYSKTNKCLNKDFYKKPQYHWSVVNFWFLQFLLQHIQ